MIDKEEETYTPAQIATPIIVNWFCSVSVVLVNKFAFRQWKFGTTLTTLHFITTFLALEVMCKIGNFKYKDLPLRKVVPLSFSFCASIVLNNLSIQYNSVCFLKINQKIIMVFFLLFYFFLNCKGWLLSNNENCSNAYCLYSAVLLYEN